eukprot:2319103-Prymnesium_polylepis.2
MPTIAPAAAAAASPHGISYRDRLPASNVRAEAARRRGRRDLFVRTAACRPKGERSGGAAAAAAAAVAGRTVPVEERVGEAESPLGVVHAAYAEVGHLEEAFALHLRLVRREEHCAREVAHIA